MKPLKKAYVEITNVCNRHCAFCPGTGRPKAFMTDAGFACAVERLAGRVRCLYLHVMGEPLMHPRLSAFLAIAGQAGLPVNLTTNGTLLADSGKQLPEMPALRQVNVSLHSLHDNADGRRCLQDAVAFARRARRAGHALVSFRLWNGREGEGNPGNAWMIERLADEFGAFAHAGSRSGGKGVRLADGVYLNFADRFDWPDISSPDTVSSGFCMGMRDQIGILCDGTVVPCCLDADGAVPLGNIWESPLEEILSSPRAAAIHRGFSRRQAVEALCQRCGYRKRFG